MAESGHKFELERRAAQKIELGELPVPGEGITRAGGGSGAACDLCTREIGKSKIEYEFEWHKAGMARVLRFHLECFQAWISNRPRPDS